MVKKINPLKFFGVPGYMGGIGRGNSSLYLRYVKQQLHFMHPDKGGDDELFKEAKPSYDELRAAIDGADYDRISEWQKELEGDVVYALPNNMLGQMFAKQIAEDTAKFEAFFKQSNNREDFRRRVKQYAKTDEVFFLPELDGMSISLDRCVSNGLERHLGLHQVEFNQNSPNPGLILGDDFYRIYGTIMPQSWVEPSFMFVNQAEKERYKEKLERNTLPLVVKGGYIILSSGGSSLDNFSLGKSFYQVGKISSTPDSEQTALQLLSE